MNATDLDQLGQVEFKKLQKERASLERSTDL